jgi:hypothetical protein
VRRLSRHRSHRSLKIHLYEDYLENISQRRGDQNSSLKENEEGESDDVEGNTVENKVDDGFF